MSFADYHTHTTFSDGKNAPEEMVRAAIDRGMTEIGISDHSYTAFDESWCMPKDALAAYQTEVKALREKYAARIHVALGIEMDAFSEINAEGFDYIIGSVHYIRAEGRYWPVDESGPEQLRGAYGAFGGDMIAYAEAYFDTVAAFAERPEVTIVGHFDLVTKFNENNCLFDASDVRCRTAWRRAADALLQAGKIFEINTGAISRGYRSAPYPSAEICAYLRERGAHFLLSSDSHSVGTLGYQFDQWRGLAGTGLLSRL